MTRTKTWPLTDVAGEVWLDSFAVANDGLHLPTPHDWAVRKRTLRGGLRDGVDLIEVHNGALSFSVLPTRGMGLWRGDYRGLPLGWRAPVVGPVHPKFVNQADRGGLGWLAGFDELLCRCGLSSNGPPGEDIWADARGAQRRAQLTFDALVEACARLLPELGYAGVTTNHVAEAAGVGIASLYEYFPGKDAIVTPA